MNSRKADLEAQLRQVESDIQAVAQGSTSSLAGAPAQTEAPPVESAAPEAAAPPEVTPPARDLGLFLLALLREAGQPLTVKQLATEVENRRYPTRSRNINGLVQTKVQVMAKKGLLARAKDQPGYTLPSTRNGHKAGRVKGHSKGKGRSQPAASARTPPQTQTGGKRKQPPLRVVLTDLLGKSKHPLSTAELATQALAAGYHTTSTNFPVVVGVMLPQMANVENVPGQGYRLKRS
jgi:hypothetical protein